MTIPIHPDLCSQKKVGENLTGEDSKSGAKGGAKLTSRQQEIINIIRAEPTISYREVAQRMKINDSAAQGHFDNLKKKGVIKRIGPAKGGHWKVFE